jgi:uncharacterized protein (DUF2237 family)
MSSTKDFSPQLNILGTPLKACCHNPKTGFYRDGFCHTGDDDHGLHTVCIEATEEFLAFSRSVGNDLSTPRPEFAFPGVKPKDRWCLCAGRWLEAYKNNAAPTVDLEATHEETCAIIPLDILKRFQL